MELESLRAHEVEGGVSLVDEAVGEWLVDVALAEPDESLLAPPSPATLVVVGTLAQQFPQVAHLLRDGSGIKVAFSPYVRQGLLTGQFRLMQSGKDLIPVAVDATGRIVGQARVAPESVATAAGGIAIGATAAAAWPLVLAGAVAAAAAYSEQRWLERTLDRLQSAVERIEHRLRDDDAGTLEAANALTELVKPGATAGLVSPYLQLELASARQEVERIYRSRRQFVERFKQVLEQEQIEHEGRTGERTAWVKGVGDELRDRGTGVFDELVLFLQAMIVRGRVTACAAAVVAAEGDGRSALRMLDLLEPELRHDYYDLHNRVRALARSAPQESWRDRLTEAVGRRIPIFRDDEIDEGPRHMEWLSTAMATTIGERFEAPPSELSVVLRSADIGVELVGTDGPTRQWE